MIEKKVRRFELNSEEATWMLHRYLSEHHSVENHDLRSIKLKLACDTGDGGLVIEVEVEG